MPCALWTPAPATPDLTDDYADITREMGAVAAHFGRQVLRDVPEADFRAAIPELRRECGDRAVLRALHFYADDRKALDEADALEARDFNRFLALVNASGLSSALHLQNTWSVADPRAAAIPPALAIGPGAAGGHWGHPGPRRWLCRHHPSLCPRGKVGLLPDWHGKTSGGRSVPHPPHPPPGRLCGVGLIPSFC